LETKDINDTEEKDIATILHYNWAVPLQKTGHAN